jgi:hypothetical protein
MRTIQERLTTEDVIEGHLTKRVKAARGQTIKIRFMRGWPDRIVLLPGGLLLFVELKRPVGGKFEPLQERIHDKLRRLGFAVYVWHTKALIDDYFSGREQ